MKKQILNLALIGAAACMTACTNGSNRQVAPGAGPTSSDYVTPTAASPAPNINGATTAKTTTITTETTTDQASRGSLGGSTVGATNADTGRQGTPAGSDVDPQSLKPATEHSAPAGNTNDASAFNRPPGNSLRSAINGDANNPKTTVVAQGEPASVGAVILQQMLSKDDEYNTRIATIKEHQDALAPAQRKFVRQTLKDATREKHDFDKILAQLRDDANNNKLENQLNVASAKIDRCLRKIEARMK